MKFRPLHDRVVVKRIDASHHAVTGVGGKSYGLGGHCMAPVK